MKFKPIYRFFFLFGAFIVALLIVYVLSITGDRTKGPLHNFFSKTGEKIVDIENSLMMKGRENTRQEKLADFDSLATNIDSLKHPVKILLGVSDNSNPESFQTIINLEDSLGLTFPLLQIYNAWGSKPEEQFPTVAVKTIVSLGSVPVITWEPWLSDFDEEDYPGIPKAEKRGKGSLKEIAKGTYDGYIRKWASDAKQVGSSIFLRFGHEMNDPYRYPWGPQNNKPADFVAAWQHVHDIFHDVGADNIVWVWAPHTAYGYFDAYYPGEEYVDYIGIGVLNFGTAATWSKWWTFDQLFESGYEKLSAFNKPFMITEFGSLIVGGNRAKWFADALRAMPEKYPLIKAVLFFHYPNDKTITDKAVSWYFIDDKETRDSIMTQINNWPDSLKLIK